MSKKKTKEKERYFDSYLKSRIVQSGIGPTYFTGKGWVVEGWGREVWDDEEGKEMRRWVCVGVVRVERRELRAF